MQRRVRIFVSLAVVMISVGGATAILQIRDWTEKFDASGNYYSYSSRPNWATWLGISILGLGLLSPILTWPLRDPERRRRFPVRVVWREPVAPETYGERAQ